MAPSDQQESVPLLDAPDHAEAGSASLSAPTAKSSGPSTSPLLSSASRSKLQGRRYLSASPEARLRELDSSSTGVLHASSADEAERGEGAGSKPLSAKARGKRPARSSSDSSNTHFVDVDPDGDADSRSPTSYADGQPATGSRIAAKPRKGRNITVIFANLADLASGQEGELPSGNLELWVEDGESVGSVKDQIRTLRPAVSANTLRLIHAGRLLTDGILLLPWLRSLEERVRRQAGGMGGDVEEVLKEVGLGEGEGDEENEGASRDEGEADVRPTLGRRARRSGKEEAKVFLHCTVGSKEGEVERSTEDDEPAAPRRRGFDVLLDAGLSQADVAQMRRQFYESRGEEVPEGLDRGDVDDEHARALEEQWIEGDMTADTATTSTEGNYSSILHGLLIGFLYPVLPIFYFREAPLPNFFDAEAEARVDVSSSNDAASTALSGLGDVLVHSIFSTRVQMGVLLGLVVNLAFGALRYVN